MKTTKEPQYSPKQDYLMLSEMEDAEVSAGGIIIPSTARYKINQGKVLEKGPLCSNDICKIGEIVVFTQHMEYRVVIDGKAFILIKESEIICGDNCSTPPSEEEPKKEEKRRPIGMDWKNIEISPKEKSI